jgi:hypothetical protein
MDGTIATDASLEILPCFLWPSLPHLPITLGPVRLRRLAGADETHEDDWLRRVIRGDASPSPGPKIWRRLPALLRASEQPQAMEVSRVFRTFGLG